MPDVSARRAVASAILAHMRSPSIPLALTVLLVAGCGDDGASPDAGPPVDAGGSDAGPAAEDAGPGDAGTTRPDAGPLPCFALPLDDIPLASPETFSASTPTWRRPHDDDPVCPASGLLPDTAAEVPFVVYAYCNEDAVEHAFDIEMLGQTAPDDGPALDDPYLVVYEGMGIPDDPTRCLAINDDIPDALDAKDSLIEGLVVPPGGAITVVGTTFTFDPSDGTGTGYHLVVVTNAD